MLRVEEHSKVSMAWILGLGPSLGLVRVPGIGLVYTELARGVPHIFSHFVTNLPAIHYVVVFVCMKYLSVHTVLEEERFLVRRIEPKDFYMFRCIARHGYKDLHKKDDDFENKLFDNLFRFVKLETMVEGCSDLEEYSLDDGLAKELRNGLSGYSGNELSSIIDVTISSVGSMTVNSAMPSNQVISQNTYRELEHLRNSRDAGVVHTLGNAVVVAREDSSLWKKIAIDYAFALLRKLCRKNIVVFNVPHESLLNVGQVIHV
ncbi:unnamed protein product [Dovyalis caffra]|uniref:K+ potassium transporter C-terminal domain-containing protein n=1 Tax=Dovyalis caffra TaxID=77055 RepID=A0AAV1SQB0_9ROSI|nr:unnamed protein product [Dovyalis caffra]